MGKIFKFLPIFLIPIFFAPIVLAQNNPTLQLKPLFTNPNPTDPRQPAPPTDPRRPRGPQSPEEFCKAMQVNYQVAGESQLDQTPRNFQWVFPNSNFLIANPHFITNSIKTDRYAANASNKDTLLLAATQIYSLVLQHQPNVSEKAGKDWKEGMDSTGINSLTHTTVNEITFYTALFKILDYTVEDNSSREDHRFMNAVMFDITTGLQTQQLPLMPHTIGNTNLGVYDKLSIGYPVEEDWQTAMDSIGCYSRRPRFVYSVSPTIHLYSKNLKSVQIKFNNPSQISFATPNYTLTDGFNLSFKDSKSSAYYEITKDSLIGDIFNSPAIIIKGSSVEEFISKLLDSLKLSSEEKENFLSLELAPQLKNIEEDSVYELRLLQNREVDTLIPIEALPTPDILLRNLIVIKKVSNIEPLKNWDTYFNSYAASSSYSPPRDGSQFVLIENGILVLD